MNRSRMSSIIKELVMPLIVGIVAWFIAPIEELRKLYTSDTNIIIIILVILIFIILSTITYVGILYTETQVKIENIRDHVGTNVELLNYGDTEKYKSPFEVPIKLIKEAKKEILILDYFPWPGSSENDPKIKDIDARYESYYDALISAAERIDYHRIIQLPESASHSIVASLIRVPFIKKHFLKMMELSSNKNRKTLVSVKTSKTAYPTTTFIVIDEKYVIWEIPYTLDGKEFKFDLDLYIEDSKGDLAKALKTRFNKMTLQAIPLDEIINDSKN